MERKLLNRIKVVLAEKNKSNKWLSEQLDKDSAIISKNVTQLNDLFDCHPSLIDFSNVPKETCGERHGYAAFPKYIIGAIIACIKVSSNGN